ncbi:monovalent cation:proton antiporter-2 (CPA2) family protein [Legionella waltersii]|uniref:Glutathione-regulated potassium efflux system n=1 Tax=Legionella waltersii TaxID=66969 RepID=A0A0W1AMD4_9GAMM|nr:monovalent cation:proton antiporter-2 (CPA2) family protein [Legionella waltersii]KTD82517.1 glutathione-regulated potassium efflux system [Legionella waltersii]SNV03009.1 monovalent cation-H antiporter-2, CPA2 family [Legionella waltersii]
MNGDFLLNIFIFLATASIMVPIASRFRLGSVIGYLLVGVLIGPYGLKLIGNPHQIMNFAEFGVIMMLFLIGLELEPKTLWKLRKLIIGLGGLQVILTTGLLTSIGMFMGYAWKTSLAISMALSLSSTALVLQMLQEKNLLKTVEGETAFAVLLFQDIAVIPILIILPLLGSHNMSVNIDTHMAASISNLPNWMHALLVTGIIGAVILIGHYASRHLFLIIAKTNIREVFTAFSLALVVGIALLMEKVGVSPALGAFIAGTVLANSQYKRTVEADIQPFKGLLLGLFFISVGMGINFNLFYKDMSFIIPAVFGLVAIKVFVLVMLGLLFKLTKIQAIGFATAISQGGEFAFVLFQYASMSKVISPELSGLYTLIVALSMLTTPFLILIYQQYLIPRLMSKLPEHSYDSIHDHSDIIIAGYGRFGQIIGRFLTGEKLKVTVLEKNPDQIELLRKFGYTGYFGDANRLDLLTSAGAAHAKMLVVTMGNPEASLEIVKLAKQEFPNLTIYARARNRRHAYELHKLGVHYFKRELFDSSLTMTKEILKGLGYKDADVEKKASAFQKYDEEILYKSFEFFDKEADLISFSRQAKGELESILQNSK